MTQLIDPTSLESYARDGFVVVDGLLTDDELDHYEQHVTAAVAHRTRADDRALDDRSPYEQSFRQCINLWEDFPEVQPLTFHPKLAQAASELVGKDVMRLWHDQALYKEAGGRRTDPHQDQPYWPIVETDTITVWIPFQGSTLASGAMGYLPGSHLIGVRKFVNIFQADGADALMELPEIKSIEPRYVEVPRGAVAFHAGLTVHMAGPNTTGTDRAVHTVIYLADGCTRRNAAFHPSVDRDEIEVGAPIRGSCTPVVWPRDAGDPVPRPAPIPEFVRQIAGHGTLPEERVR